MRIKFLKLRLNVLIYVVMVTVDQRAQKMIEEKEKYMDLFTHKESTVLQDYPRGPSQQVTFLI